jgi:hypothetical protein
MTANDWPGVHAEAGARSATYLAIDADLLDVKEKAQIMSKDNVTGDGAALIAAVTGAGAAGIHSAAAEETPSDAGAPADKMASKALTSMETWGGSLALQAATYAAPLVAMYNLRSTVCFGPKAKSPTGDNLEVRGHRNPDSRGGIGLRLAQCKCGLWLRLRRPRAGADHPHRARLERPLLHD